MLYYPHSRAQKNDNQDESLHLSRIQRSSCRQYSPMPRLIRRRPLAERIRTYLDPADFLLWLSEELDSSDWDQWQRDWAGPIGVLLNFVFLIARANSGYGRQSSDDVFGDDISHTSWTSWFVRVVLPSPVSLSEGTDQDLSGRLRRALPLSLLFSERLLHLLSPAPLSALREQCGKCPKHSIRTPSSS